MAAADIQVVNPTNLQKIESFFNDSAYREAIENSASFNTRLCVERRQRMPFLDPQTGVAQTHCSLFMNRRQRMPGAREGQIYTYPAARWRKARRQYLSLRCGNSGRWGSAPWSSAQAAEDRAGDMADVTADGASMDAHDTDSKDSHHRDNAKDDMPKEWFYDDIGMEEMDGYDEPEPESDEDYCDDSYASRRKRGPRGATTTTVTPKGKRRGTGDTPKAAPSESIAEVTTPKGRGRGGGRGRKKAVQQMLPYEVAGDADKPYGCELCGARYKTRPGLTYHYTHSHKEAAEAAATSAAGTAAGSAGSDNDSRDSPADAPQPAEYQDSYVTFLNNPAGPTPNNNRRPRPTSTVPVPVAAASVEEPVPPPPTSPARASPPPEDEVSRSSEPPASPSVLRSGKPPPSPYCDFCLGDHRENKKTNIPEELVSCSDCGRSGKLSLALETAPATAPAGRKPGRKRAVANRNNNCNHDSDTSSLKNNASRESSPFSDNGILVHSKSYPADDFDQFVRKKLMEGAACGKRTSGRARSGEEDSWSENTDIKSPPPRTPETKPVTRKSARKNSASAVATKRTRRKI